jgi:hypothetical protein
LIGRSELLVRDEDGEVRGYLTLDAVSRLLATGREGAMT